MDPVTLLIIEDDADLSGMLATSARLRRYESYAGATIADARRLIASRTFHAALVDLTLGAESGLDVVRAIRETSPDTAIVVISATTSLASAIASYEMEAFAFVPKPFDVDQLFSTVERAVEHRRVRLANRRLLWEQRLINEVGDELRFLVDPEELVDRVLRHLMSGMGVDTAGARLLNPDTREYDMRRISASPEARAIWTAPEPPVVRPSDRVLATKQPVSVADLHQGLDAALKRAFPVRSAVSVPMFIGPDLLGVLTFGSLQPNRFSPEDERLLGIIANQIAVAFQNARLHAFVRAGKQEWEATFDAIGDPIAVFDRKGRLLRGNAALAAGVRRPITALRGLSCDEIGLCGGAFPRCSVGHASGGACSREEITREDGQIFSVTTAPVLDAADGAAIVQIAKNMTSDIQNARRMRQMSDELAAANGRLVATLERLKSTQAQLLQAEKLSAIGQLVAGVAHELNNPLTSVIGYAQLLQEETRERLADDPRAQEQLARDLRRIAEESERAAKIVRNLLAFARRQSAARAPEDVADLMGRVLALRAYEFRLNAIHLETDFEPDLPPVLGDAGQLQQALLNLLLNAEQAMRASDVRRLRVAVRLVADADAVELSISDNGHGIPDENLRRIFDPFFTTREVGEGTGLGLSICYGIVRDHGGQISVDSGVGQGATFKVLLPARASQDRESARTLVAHRDTTERDYVAAALTGWGLAVTPAESGDDALQRIRTGAFDVAFVERGLMADRAAWRGALAGMAHPPALVLMAESAADEGVAPPFELTALRGALRGVMKECV